MSVIARLYRTLPANSRTRNYLLNWLASLNTNETLNLFSELIVEEPPTCEATLVMAFAPLVQRDHEFEIAALFPQILGGLQHPGVAAAILDLANFVTREQRVEHHPAADHVDSLINMLGLLTEQLTMIEEGNLPPNVAPEQLSRLVNDTVSLIASVCDALALLGDRRAMGKLSRAAELKHRRIRAEALAALCRLGDDESASELVSLASEPVTRLRVLNYCEELGLSDQIDEAFTSDAARAESELAIWLASPANMGLAPRSLQVVDRRTMAWPSFDEPIECFLIQYSYELASQEIRNIGIVGPLTHAFSIPLTHLPEDDIYAAFAGWQCTHEEISELSMDQADSSYPGLTRRLLSRLSSEQLEGLVLETVAPVFMGLFMGNQALIAEGIRHERHGTVVVDRDEVMWFETDSGQSPGRNELAWSVYKGRRLLSAFNAPEIWPGESGASPSKRE